jgi:hypothetical protein
MTKPDVREHRIECVNCHKIISYARKKRLDSPFTASFGALVPCTNCGSDNRDHGTTHRTNFEFSRVSKLLRTAYTTEPQCPQLARVHRVFVRNMDQVLAFGRMPQLFQFHYRIFKEYIEFKDDAMLIASPYESEMSAGMMMVQIEPKDVDPQLARVSSLGMRIALNGLLSSMIAGTWTAFETLAGDLWESALNAAPKRLALLNGPAHRIEKMVGSKAKAQSPADQANSQDDSEEDGIADRAVSLNAMHRASRGTFNFRRLRGTVQREGLGFDSLNGIREAYSRAFHKPFSKEIDQALADRRLDAIQEVRNLLVHKAGVADQRYIDRARKFPTAPRVEKHRRLKLTGVIVADLIEPVMQIAARLIAGVDERVIRETKTDGQ